MHTADYVSALINDGLSQGIDKQELAWKAALACEGWAYVFGARGQFCTPANRRSRASAEHPMIQSACKNFDGQKLCNGCRWYPDNNRTRFFDCRGFTYWILKQVYGFDLNGGGATSQWKDASNWTVTGTIDSIPYDTLVCLFVKKGSKMEHTGFGYHDETVECSNGVQHFTKRSPKWTHWCIPACVQKEDSMPTLRKGSSGACVTSLQTALMNRGYDLGKWGADGKFGDATEKAVKAFQADMGLTVDGIVGPKTWTALEDKAPVKYSVYIPSLTLPEAQKLVNQYPNAYMSAEDS